MEIRATEQDGISILALSGRMDAGTTPEFDRAAQALLGQGKNVVLIDMEDLEYISSAGLRGILGLVKAIKAASGRLAFCRLQPMAAEVFRISGFNAMLAVHATREEAIGVLRG